MAIANPSLIISVSAFGFGDSVNINGEPYTQTEQTPNIIIEDPRNKMHLYGDRALHEQTSSGLNLNDDPQNRILVSVLWQQLKESTDIGLKQEAANRISKHVLQLICDIKPILAADEDESLANKAKLLNRSDLRTNAQIVLLIPDNFTEAEQQCLLNAFLGYNLRLLWRSVAALIGSIATSEQKELRKLVTSQKTGQRPSIQVLYIGADSIDLSTYEFKISEDSSYYIPVRLKPVYHDCAIGLNFLHFALSVAQSYAQKIALYTFEPGNPNSKQQIEHSIIQQLLSNNANIWGLAADLQQTIIKVDAGQTHTWLQLSDFKKSDNLSQELRVGAITDFYQLFGLRPNLTNKQSWNQTTDKSSIVNQLAKALKDKLAPNSPCLIVGSDQLVKDNALYAHLRELVQDNSNKPQLTEIEAQSLSDGGYIFQKRLNNKAPTYLDRLSKLSIIVINEAQDEYQESILIEEKEIAPQTEVQSQPKNYKILQDANSIELYVSNDPLLNDETIERATRESFKQQNISVKRTELQFSAGAKADKNETVTVTAMQKPLSGYVKIKIKPADPSKPSKVLPPYGVTYDFIPAQTPDFEKCLHPLNRSYPPLVEPQKDRMMPPTTRKERLSIDNTIFMSNKKGQLLVYYNSKFVKGYEEKINQCLQEDSIKINTTLKMIQDRINYSSRFSSNIRQMLPLLESCLPITMYRPFGRPHDTQLVDTIHDLLKIAIAKDARTERNKLIRYYCFFVADYPADVQKCCSAFSSIGKLNLNNRHLNSLKILIENHPKCFNPRSEQFCMTEDFAILMKDNSISILKSFTEVDAQLMLKNLTVKGSKNLSISLMILMYSLMIRRKNRDFLASGEQLVEIKGLLNQVLEHYRGIAAKINREIADTHNRGITVKFNHSTKKIQNFQSRLNDFVDNKLSKLIPEVIEYLEKKGTNSNIMADITALDIEDEKV